MSNISMRKNITEHSESLTNLALNEIANCVSANTQFTAYNITQKLRINNPDYEINHDDVKLAVKRWFKNQNEYDVSASPHNGFSSFLIYHPEYQLPNADYINSKTQSLTPTTNTNSNNGDDFNLGPVLHPDNKKRLRIPAKYIRELDLDSHLPQVYVHSAPNGLTIISAKGHSKPTHTVDQYGNIRIGLKQHYLEDFNDFLITSDFGKITITALDV